MYTIYLPMISIYYAVYIYVCMYIYMYVCIYIYTYTERDRQIDRVMYRELYKIFILKLYKSAQVIRVCFRRPTLHQIIDIYFDAQCRNLMYVLATIILFLIISLQLFCSLRTQTHLT